MCRGEGKGLGQSVDRCLDRWGWFLVLFTVPTTGSTAVEMLVGTWLAKDFGNGWSFREP